MQSTFYAIGLLTGAGGFSAGATMAGCNVGWVANHSPSAVEIHAAYDSGAQLVCQDLHEANWAAVPNHDIPLASPCCQGHSQASGNPQQDASRSTAWAVMSTAESHRPAFAAIENVPAFLRWSVHPAWRFAMESLG